MWDSDHRFYTDASGHRWSAEEIAAKQKADPTGNWGGEQASGNPLAVMGQSNPGGSTGVTDGSWQAGNDALVSMGFIPKHVDPNAPGGHLDTSNADEEKARIAPLLAQLQQQAASGGGAWEGILKAGTQRADATAQALGQSQPGAGYASSMRTIGNAQAGAEQRAVGEGNTLRAQSQAGAQDQLSNLLASQGDTEANQAAAGAAANQGVNDLQRHLNQAASSNFENATGAIGNAFTGGGAKMSRGGEVPGKPKVFGDSSVNDTVKAKLSPGELVVPRSHADSPEHAEQFIRALFASRGVQHPPAGVQHFDGGGTAGDGSGLTNGTADGGTTALQVLAPHVGQIVANGQNNSPQAPSIGNGGLLDTRGFDTNRAAALQNSNLLMGRAIGNGPSVAGQELQNSTDASIAAGMHGGPGGVGRAVTEAQMGAGRAAETKLHEQAGGEEAATRALSDQRARDNAFAQAMQGAAFRNTGINAGLDLAQQAQLRNVIGGAGQAAVSASSMGGKSADFSGSDLNTPSFDQGTSGPGSSPDEWANPYAHGGEVHARASGRSMTAPRRAEPSVDVQALPPSSMVTVHQPDYAPAAAQPGYRPHVEEHDDYSVQMAHGGQVDPDELRRASEFLSALRQRRAA